MRDKQIEKLIKSEAKRQKNVINLIASENYVSKDVLQALGSELTNKYAEGYPGRRYYGGNSVIDKVELLCIERALKLFKLKKEDWHVNVQLLSGSPANFALYSALVPIGNKIMGMKLISGGHLTHGHHLSMTGKLWKPVQFEVDPETEVIDYEKLKQIAMTEMPSIIVAGFTAYPRIVDFKKFREIADACGALLHIDMSHFAGLVAGGVYPSPFPYADSVMTTTHKSLRGPRQAILFVKKDSPDTLPGARRDFDKKIDKMVIPGLFGGPHENNIAGVAIALKEADTMAFKKYAKQVVKNAKVLAEELQKLGWHVISGGTDSHLILLDTWMNGAGIPGKDASERLEKAGIIVNMNTIPGEGRSAMDPSGIRLGTYAETTRGKKEKSMIVIARKINKILRKK
ncbi:MAG TPA: serine hydroxymethyltransferase [Candidatus Paceibacterota bacterium]|nr:serine hydroxymethyltransferase [Candidatus Paceibacterota bacterium]HPT18067.1 serine hydroxymethyltransferase [Candidatus Paceibacterota bacterium]